MTPSGTKVGSESKPYTTTTLDKDYPKLISFPSGGFLIAWAQFNGADWDILARRYDNSGTPVSTLGNPTGNPFNPTTV